MATLPLARVGSPLSIRQQPLEFSFFAMGRTVRRWGLNAMIYASDPWAVIESSLEGRCIATEKRTAQSFVRQAQEYFGAAERAGAIETRPLLYYYSFLNLSKALALSKRRPRMIGKVMHGIAQDAGTGFSVAGSEVQLQGTTAAKVSALDELHRCLTGKPIPHGNVPIREILAQSVVGHRLWLAAANRRERFLGIEDVRLLHDSTNKRIWANVMVRSTTMASRGRSLATTLTEGGLTPSFKAVRDLEENGFRFRQFEQTSPVSYNHRPSDETVKVIAAVRPLVWQTVTSSPPYRHYYLYLSPPGEIRLPQVVSIYATLFWLGSMTRYQPAELLALLDGPYGAFLREFLATQPMQLLYIYASEFAEQDVSRAAVV